MPDREAAGGSIGGREGSPSTKSGGVAYTRVAAIFVLLLAIPGLLLSVITLGVFYAIPDRFGNLLARLPGEAVIRTVLIFAPVTLLAVVVLAVLYAFEKPVLDDTKPIAAVRVEAEAVEVPRINLRRLGWQVLVAGLLLLLLFITVQSAAFLSPAKFDNFIGKLPGGGILQFLSDIGFFLLVGLVLIALFLTYGTRRGVEGSGEELNSLRRWVRTTGPSRFAIGVVLLFSLPLFLLSMLSLTVFFIRPEGVLNFLTNFSKEVILRMGMVFVPASLFIVVALAILFLLRRVSVEESVGVAGTDGVIVPADWSPLRWYGSWALVFGLTAAGAAIYGVITGVLVLMLR
ncbi:MAG: hypothetical protein GTO18_17790 [Anaerolineales bacterium]|nr:hypothetical protein [Anaerolineales bacterium]